MNHPGAQPFGDPIPLEQRYTSADPIDWCGAEVYPMYAEALPAGTTAVRLRAVSVLPPPEVSGLGLGLTVQGGYVHLNGKSLQGVDIWYDALADGVDITVTAEGPEPLFTLTPVWAVGSGTQQSWTGNYGMVIDLYPGGSSTLWCSTGPGTPDFNELVVELTTFPAPDPAPFVAPPSSSAAPSIRAASAHTPFAPVTMPPTPAITAAMLAAGPPAEHVFSAADAPPDVAPTPHLPGPAAMRTADHPAEAISAAAIPIVGGLPTAHSPAPAARSAAEPSSAAASQAAGFGASARSAAESPPGAATAGALWAADPRGMAAGPATESPSAAMMPMPGALPVADARATAEGWATKPPSMAAMPVRGGLSTASSEATAARSVAEYLPAAAVPADSYSGTDSFRIGDPTPAAEFPTAAARPTTGYPAAASGQPTLPTRQPTPHPVDPTPAVEDGLSLAPAVPPPSTIAGHQAATAPELMAPTIAGRQATSPPPDLPPTTAAQQATAAPTLMPPSIAAQQAATAPALMPPTIAAQQATAGPAFMPPTISGRQASSPPTDLPPTTAAQQATAAPAFMPPTIAEQQATTAPELMPPTSAGRQATSAPADLAPEHPAPRDLRAGHPAPPPPAITPDPRVETAPTIAPPTLRAPQASGGQSIGRALYDLGTAMNERGEHDSARTLLTQAAEAGHSAAAYDLGVLLLRDGDRAGAEHWWKAAAHDDPRAAASLTELPR